MLPPGHIAAGYIIAEAVIKFVPFNLTVDQTQTLSFIGMFVGFAPDLDFFYAFAKLGRMRIDNEKANHRKLIGHAPLLWLLLGLIIFFGAAVISTSNQDFYKALGLIIWLCSFGHFVLDSESGIMWAWPISKKLYYFPLGYLKGSKPKVETLNLVSPNENFFQFWLDVVKRYMTETSSYLEIIIIIIALVIALH